MNAAERREVAVWQKVDTYTFEFHEGHGTGNPIYIRPNGNEDTKNLPKFDTLNKSPSHFYLGKGTAVKVVTFANGSKLTALPAPTQADIEAVVAGSWPSLQLMAQRRWDGEKAPADPVVKAAPKNKPCSTPKCRGKVPVKAAPQGGKVPKFPCPTCGVVQ